MKREEAFEILKKYRNLAENTEISVSEQLVSYVEKTKDLVLCQDLVQVKMSFSSS